MELPLDRRLGLVFQATHGTEAFVRLQGTQRGLSKAEVGGVGEIQGWKNHGKTMDKILIYMFIYSIYINTLIYNRHMTYVIIYIYIHTYGEKNDGKL